MKTTELFRQYDDHTLKDFIAFQFGGFVRGQHHDNMQSALAKHADYIKQQNTCPVCSHYNQDDDLGYNEDDIAYDKTRVNYANSLLEAIDKELLTNLKECFLEIDHIHDNYLNESIRIDKTKANQNLLDLIYQDDSKLQALLDNVEFCKELKFDIEL